MRRRLTLLMDNTRAWSILHDSACRSKFIRPVTRREGRRGGNADRSGVPSRFPNAHTYGGIIKLLDITLLTSRCGRRYVITDAEYLVVYRSRHSVGEDSGRETRLSGGGKEKRIGESRGKLKRELMR